MALLEHFRLRKARRTDVIASGRKRNTDCSFPRIVQKNRFAEKSQTAHN